jgi:hypothetical protein
MTDHLADYFLIADYFLTDYFLTDYFLTDYFLTDSFPVFHLFERELRVIPGIWILTC